MVWSFLSLLSEVKTELKIIKVVWFNPLQCCLIWIKQIENSIGDGIVNKKARNSKKPLRHYKDPLYKHLQFDALTQIDRCKIGHRQDKNHYVSNAEIASNPNVLKIITLLNT